MSSTSTHTIATAGAQPPAVSLPLPAARSHRIMVILKGGLVEAVVTDDPGMEGLVVDIRDEDMEFPDYEGQVAWVSWAAMEVVSAERYEELRDEKAVRS